MRNIPDLTYVLFPDYLLGIKLGIRNKTLVQSIRNPKFSRETNMKKNEAEAK